jgi:hypothetical protein
VTLGLTEDVAKLTLPDSDTEELRVMVSAVPALYVTALEPLPRMTKTQTRTAMITSAAAVPTTMYLVLCRLPGLLILALS